MSKHFRTIARLLWKDVEGPPDRRTDHRLRWSPYFIWPAAYFPPFPQVYLKHTLSVQKCVRIIIASERQEKKCTDTNYSSYSASDRNTKPSLGAQPNFGLEFIDWRKTIQRLFFLLKLRLCYMKSLLFSIWVLARDILVCSYPKYTKLTNQSFGWLTGWRRRTWTQCLYLYIHTCIQSNIRRGRNAKSNLEAMHQLLASSGQGVVEVCIYIEFNRSWTTTTRTARRASSTHYRPPPQPPAPPDNAARSSWGKVGEGG